MSKWKRVLVFVGIGALGLLLAYAAGRFQTASALHGAESRIAVLASASAQDVENCEARRAVQQAWIERLEARRALHLAVIAVDDHNFGVAQGELQNATRRLSAAGQGSDKDLAEIGEQLANFRLVATEDVGEQRQRLLGLVKRFDQLVPPR